MYDLSSIWTIYGSNGPDMVQMGPDGSDMARTGRNSSSNILSVMKRHVNTFALRNFRIFSMKDITKIYKFMLKSKMIIT